MAVCEVGGNDYYRTLEASAGGAEDRAEAISAAAPRVVLEVPGVPAPDPKGP